MQIWMASGIQGSDQELALPPWIDSVSMIAPGLMSAPGLATPPRVCLALGVIVLLQTAPWGALLMNFVDSAFEHCHQLQSKKLVLLRETRVDAPLPR